MPRGAAQPVERGRPCRKCGADEWTVRTYVSGEVGWRCRPCHMRGVKASPSHHDGPTRLYRSAMYRARAAGAEFAISVDDVRNVWPDDNRCPALGIELQTGTGTLHDASPSLDRVNNAWGYLPGNIAVLSHRANRVKGNATASDLERIAAWMRANGLA